MFYCEIVWFYQDFKNENLCFFKSVLVHTARVVDPPLEIMF